MRIHRPTSVTLVAVLNILVAVAGLWALVVALFSHLVFRTDAGARAFSAYLPAYRPVTFADAALRGAVAIGMVVSAVLLLKSHRLGRKMAVAAAIASMTLWAASTAWALLVVKPAIPPVCRSVFTDPSLTAREQYEGRLEVSTLGEVLNYEICISFGIHFAYPIVMLSLLALPSVKRAFGWQELGTARRLARLHDQRARCDRSE